jgi:hypothetical protein
MTRYRDVKVGKSSDLMRALEAKDSALAAKLYDASEAAFRKQYPQCTPEWFAQRNQRMCASPQLV